MIENNRRTKLVRRVVLTAFIVLAAFWLMPVVWVLLNSFKTNEEFVRSYSGFEGPWEYLTRIFPEQINFTSYMQLLGLKDGATVLANFPSMAKTSTLPPTSWPCSKTRSSSPSLRRWAL